MKVFNKLILAGSAIAITCMLSACGGGSGGGSKPQPAPSANKVNVSFVVADKQSQAR
jgi:hypothetical protein